LGVKTISAGKLRRKDTPRHMSRESLLRHDQREVANKKVDDGEVFIIWNDAQG
jgi:hypothetical protein